MMMISNKSAANSTSTVRQCFHVQIIKRRTMSPDSSSLGTLTQCAARWIVVEFWSVLEDKSKTILSFDHDRSIKYLGTLMGSGKV